MVIDLMLRFTCSEPEPEVQAEPEVHKMELELEPVTKLKVQQHKLQCMTSVVGHVTLLVFGRLQNEL